MIKNWLSANNRPTASGRAYAVVDYTEKGPPDGNMLSYLSGLVLTSKRNPNLLKRAVDKLGSTEWKQYVEKVLSKRIQLRHGNFGEIVGKEILNKFEGFDVPIEKLRYGISKEDSLAGTDLCGFVFDSEGKITAACFGETKVRIETDKKKAVEAHAQLLADQSVHFAEILDFIANCLAEQNNPLFEQVQDLMLSRLNVPEHYRVVLVFERGKWHEDCLHNLDSEDPLLDPLTVKVVLVDNLKALIKSVFDQAGYSASFDDD